MVAASLSWIISDDQSPGCFIFHVYEYSPTWYIGQKQYEYKTQKPHDLIRKIQGFINETWMSKIHFDFYTSKFSALSTIAVVEVGVIYFLPDPVFFHLSQCFVYLRCTSAFQQRTHRYCIGMKTSFWHWCTFVLLYANWPGWRRRLFDVQIMILGHCKCANHCFSVNCLPCGVKKLYSTKYDCESIENGFQMSRVEPVENLVYSTSQH